MLKAKVNAKANQVQRHDAEHIIKEFSRVFKWRLDCNDSLIDIGTGSGDVLVDFLVPVLPKNFKKIVGSDISSDMVQHCNKTYKSLKDKVAFKILDIGTEKLSKEFVSEFDHVTSFYCLNWVQNQQQAVRNVYQILNSDGDCLLVFLASHPFYDIYKIISKNPKWTTYMKDMNCHISPFQCSKNPELEFSQIIKDEGFVDFSVEVRHKTFVYEGLQTLRENLRAVNPFIGQMPEELREEFMDEMIKIALSVYSLSESMTLDDKRFITPYRLIVAYARK
ncbi:juvenile hormone acid O-methyltransferase-like [Eupeodes corollae]|uniref:juvenile hormone acid O-methyltransferase-like n=1 Tax=Eupeodes corollae TaxID=290404 RepID=UPI0024921EAA|nr:juvenile hormone acid O-methyltransferase-like [Eupeodes corollae]